MFIGFTVGLIISMIEKVIKYTANKYGKRFIYNISIGLKIMMIITCFILTMNSVKVIKHVKILLFRDKKDYDLVLKTICILTVIIP